MALVLNGDGNVTGLTAGGLPDASITQSDLAANVSGNGPVVLASQTVNQQTFTSSVLGKVICDTKTVDTHNAYSTSTGIFQPSVAGYYMVTCRVETSNRGGAETYETIRKNGSEYARCIDITTTSWWGTPYTVLVYLNGSTDYVEHYLFQSTGGNKVTTLGAYLTYFQAALVRTA